MTKQEQIEEMAEAVVCAAIVSNAKIYDKVAIHLREFVENLYNAGYRKVPDGAVVLPREDLTKEPYNEFCKGCPNVRTRSSGIIDCCADYNCRQFTRYANLIENYKQVRKETAKEILQCLYDKCYEIQNMGRGGIAHILPIDILQLAKHYRVEVEE